MEGSAHRASEAPDLELRRARWRGQHRRHDGTLRRRPRSGRYTNGCVQSAAEFEAGLGRACPRTRAGVWEHIRSDAQGRIQGARELDRFFRGLERSPPSEPTESSSSEAAISLPRYPMAAGRSIRDPAVCMKRWAPFDSPESERAPTSRPAQGAGLADYARMLGRRLTSRRNAAAARCARGLALRASARGHAGLRTTASRMPLASAARETRLARRERSEVTSVVISLQCGAGECRRASFARKR